MFCSSKPRALAHTLVEAKPNMKQLPATLSVSFLLLVGPFFGECCVVTSDSSRKAYFYVSTDGSDDWLGSLPESNAQGTDGPFASLEQARQAVRDIKGRPSTKDVVVLIREGIYRLIETVVFGLEDSGKGDSTVTYAAYHGEEAVFCSDVEISGWKRPDTALTGLPEAARGKVWVADVPQVNGAPWRFFTLYDAEGRLPRAR
jgi:hypothetical protein